MEDFIKKVTRVGPIGILIGLLILCSYLIGNGGELVAYLGVFLLFSVIFIFCVVTYLSKIKKRIDDKHSLMAFRFIVLVFVSGIFLSLGIFLPMSYQSEEDTQKEDIENEIHATKNTLKKLDSFHYVWRYQRSIIESEIRDIEMNIGERSKSVLNEKNLIRKEWQDKAGATLKQKERDLSTVIDKYESEYDASYNEESRLSEEEKRRKKKELKSKIAESQKTLQELKNELSALKQSEPEALQKRIDRITANITAEKSRELAAIEQGVVDNSIIEGSEITEEPDETIEAKSLNVEKKYARILQTRTANAKSDYLHEVEEREKSIKSLEGEIQQLESDISLQTDTIEEKVEEAGIIKRKELALKRKAAFDKTVNDIEKSYQKILITQDSAYKERLISASLGLDSLKKILKEKVNFLISKNTKWDSYNEEREKLLSKLEQNQRQLEKQANQGLDFNQVTLLLVRSLCLGALGAMVSFLVSGSGASSEWEYVHSLGEVLLVGALVAVAGYSLLASGLLNMVVSSEQLTFETPNPFRQVFFCLILGAFADRFYSWIRDEIGRKQHEEREVKESQKPT